MEFTISPIEENSTAVEVTFVQGDVTFTRNVNAVFTDGVYDADATTQRVSEVALGVAQKIELGVIRAV